MVEALLRVAQIVVAMSRIKYFVVFIGIFICVFTSNYVVAQHDTASVVFLGRDKDNRIGVDSANYGFRIVRQYDHPYPWLNWFTFKSYTKDGKPSSWSNRKKNRTKMLISFMSGFDDHAMVYLNDSLIFNKYLRTMPSISRTFRWAIAGPQLNGTGKDIIIIKLVKSNLYLQFELDDRFDYVRIDCDKQEGYKKWWVSHRYYDDKKLVNSEGNKNQPERVKKKIQKWYEGYD